MAALSADNHNRVQQLCLQYEKANDDTKNVFIRDELDKILAPIMMQWRCLPHEVGIHPCNRDRALMSASAHIARGVKIVQSGFSSNAIGKLWAMEDNPKTQHIKMNTLATTCQDGFGKCGPDVKVGPMNWTHSNQFVCAVIDEATCDPNCGLPVTSEGRIDKLRIMNDPKQIRLAEYAKNGMIYNVIPHWIEDLYPTVPKVFQAACNQEQQVQDLICS